MPSTYAHRKIGEEVKGLLPPDIGQTVRENERFFALGLHGPDLLFYYKPLRSNQVNAEGYAMHNRFASDFFVRAKGIYLSRGKKVCDEAYLYGFLCHFALDSESHPYVNHKIAASGVTHTEIESCFDRFLMLRDGVEPFSFDLTSHIVPSESLADVASAYFAVAPEYALKAIRSIKRYNNLMNSKSCIARGFAVLALKLSGCYKEMHGMMMPKKDDKRCEDSNIALSDCYERAVEKSVRLIENLHAYIGGAACLSSELDRDFE